MSQSSDLQPRTLTADDHEPLTGHKLKTWPEFYEAIVTGAKHFEVRKDDRGFAIGDLLWLEEWNPTTREYTGRYSVRQVSYILTGGQFGIEPGYIVMGWRSEV